MLRLSPAMCKTFTWTLKHADRQRDSYAHQPPVCHRLCHYYKVRVDHRIFQQVIKVVIMVSISYIIKKCMQAFAECPWAFCNH